MRHNNKKIFAASRRWHPKYYRAKPLCILLSRAFGVSQIRLIGIGRLRKRVPTLAIWAENSKDVGERLYEPILKLLNF